MLVVCFLLFLMWVSTLLMFLGRTRPGEDQLREKPAVKRTHKKEVRVKVFDHIDNSRVGIEQNTVDLEDYVLTPMSRRGLNAYKKEQAWGSPSTSVQRSYPSALTKTLTTQRRDNGLTVKTMTAKETWTEEYSPQASRQPDAHGVVDDHWLLTSLLFSGVLIMLLTVFVIH